MVILIAIALLFASFIAVEVVKDTYTKAKDRRDDRIMAAYQRQQAARQHAANLADIERIRQATAEELVRVAAEASSEFIEGTAVEVQWP
jgi:hypothetical protein